MLQSLCRPTPSALKRWFKQEKIAVKIEAEKPSIAVLPFNNMSKDPDQEWPTFRRDHRRYYHRSLVPAMVKCHRKKFVIFLQRTIPRHTQGL